MQEGAELIIRCAAITVENLMKSNVGTVDRVIRALIGIGLLSLLFILEGNARWWGLVGILPLATAFMRWCPAYIPFGIDTGASKSD
jgi:hypothetical protein